MNTLVISLSLLCGSPESDAAAAIAIAMAQKAEVKTVVPDDAYAVACKKSVRLKQKLAVHVGCKRAEVGGLINVRVDSLEGFTAPCVVICRPEGDWVVWERTVSPDASDREALGLQSPARFLDPRSVPRQEN